MAYIKKAPMTGEFNFTKFAKFLRSFWGTLSAFTVSLPTIIYFLSTEQIKDSVLSEYYIGIPTTFAILVIPFIFLYEDILSSLTSVRKSSIVFIILSFLTLFSFLTVKNIYIAEKVYTKQDNLTNEIIKIQENKKGLISLETYSSENSNPIKQEERINILELISLCLFSLSIIFLTVSFSSLGIFFYTKSIS